MESATPHHLPTFRREVRLGLVAASGLSLSSYTSGICQEFYQAVRGRGIYKLLKALVDADLIVDTISGTSAGGMNAVLLSYALTNSTATQTVDFNVFNEVWQNNADIYQLLHQPAAATSTLLDGDGYHQQQLEAAFVNAFQHRVPPPEREWVSPLRELDLLLTSTDFWGKTYRLWDDGGAMTLVQDHATLFHLKHRQGRKEPFNPFGFSGAAAKPQDTFQALAKLCRLTSALPMVFPTVQVDLNNSQNFVDRQLGLWGQLDRRHWQHRPEGKQLSFFDGSLLGQALLQPAMRTMYYRPPDRWTQRLLFYIDPAPSKGRESVAMFDQPLSYSISTDLRQVREHNQKVQRYQELLAVAENRVSSSIDNAESQIQQHIYRRSRLINLRTQAIPLLTRLASGSDHDRQPELERITRLIADHQVSAVDKDQREACLQNFAPQMAQLDVDYSLRHHFYLTHKIHEQLIATKSPHERFYLEVLIKRIGQSIQLLEVIKASLQQLLSNVVISDNFYAMLGVKKSDYFLRPLVYEYIFRLHRYLLDVQALPLPSRDELPTHWDEVVSLSELFLNLPLTANETQSEWLPSDQISTIWQQLQQKIEILATAANQGQYLWNRHRFHYDQRENQRFLSMLTQIESATTMLLHNSPTTAAQLLLHQFKSFEQLDRVLYPLEYLTDLAEKEPLHIVRISPATAQLGWSRERSASEKLAGHNFYPAGGLFKKSWRVNDLLWGRLDGLDRIMAGIVSPVTVQCFSGLVQRESMRLAMTPADYLEFLLTESLPAVVGQERQQLKAHLTHLAQPNLEITQEQLRDRLQDLVMAGHRQILTTNWEQVGQNTTIPEKMWGLKNSQALAHKPLQSSMMQMARAITQESLDNLTTEQQQFFRQQYKVGSAQLFENTPGMVWINWLSRLVLALQDLFVNLLGKLRVDESRRNTSYRLVNRLIRNLVNQLLDSWYWWLQSRGIKLVLKTAQQPLRLLGRWILAVVLGLSVVLTTFNPLIWLVLGLMTWLSWGVLTQQLWLHRRKPPKFQKLLTVKSLVDR
jgi:patatin-related protein